MAAFDDEIQNDWVGVRFFCTIDGIDKIFLDGPALKGRFQNAWTAPTSKGYSYELLPYTLDLSGGLADIGQEILRREGATAPGAMTIRLTDDRQDSLLNLFARDKRDGNRAVAAESIPHDTTGAGTVIECGAGELSGWAASGTAFLGRECIRYRLIDGNNLGDSGNKCTRDVFSVGSSDVAYVKNDHSSQAPRVLTDFPAVWHNRCVRLFGVLVDRDGYTLSAAGSDWFTDEHTRELFRGVLQGNPEPDGSLASWTMRLRTIDALLHSNVGKEPGEGTLVRVAGNWQQNDAGQNLNPFGVPSPIVAGFFITDSTTTFSCTLHRHSSDHVEYYTKTLFAPGDFVTMTDLMDKFTSVITPEIQALTGGTPFPTVELSLDTWGSKGSAGGINPDTGTTAMILWLDCTPKTSITFHWSEANSVGKLLNANGGLFNWADANDATITSGTGYVTPFPHWFGYGQFENPPRIAYIGKADTTIPFFQSSDQGQSNETPASAGYCKIGDEIISYGSITALDSTLEGLYRLNDCERGQLGTMPAIYVPELGPDGQALGDPVVLKFIQAFNGVSIFDAILQLATSTGSEHHGAFDTMGAATGPAIPPEHFDLGAIAKLKNGSGLMDDEHHISYWFDEPKQLSELIANWLKPLNMFVTARTGNSGSYQITIEQALPPLQSESYHSISASNVSADNFGSWRSGADMITNELAVKYQFDVAEGKAKDHKIVARDLDSIADYGVKGRLSWELQGYQWSYTTAIKRVYRWARRVFRRYGRPYDLLEMFIDRTGWSIKPGETVTVSVPAVPNTDGSRGFTYKASTVLGVQHTYHAPDGTPGTKLLLALEAVERQSSYVPSARATGYNAGTATLTLAANSYTEANDSTDADHFEQGDKVRVFNEGTAETYDDRTITVISGNNVTLNSALSAVTHSATATVMTAQAYDDVTSNQTQHVYIATLSGSGLDLTGFKYV